jgi:hypothetical protein
MRYRWNGAILLAGVVITVLNVAIVWSHRFLPLYDYPIWLYVVKIMQGLSHGSPLYSSAFEYVVGPVPNLAFVGMLWAISDIVSIEVAGKALLTFCVVAFPWSWWWSSRRIADAETPWAYLGFPFALNVFFWGRLGYLIAFILLLPALGLLLPRVDRFNRWGLVALGLVTLFFFFLHGVVFVVWSMVLAVILLRSREKWKAVVAASVLAPALLCGLWYVTTLNGATWLVMPSWGVSVILRSGLKPLMLFIKSYGIASPGPVSLYNILWLALLLLCVLAYVVEHRWRVREGASWLVVCACAVACGVALPLNTLGVYQPGAYFVIPAIFLLSVAAKTVRRAGILSSALLVCALGVSVFSFQHTSRVDAQMQQFYADFRSTVDVARPHTVVSLDWPAETGPGDLVSASINPLFGVPFYALLERDGLSWIFETSIIRLKPSYAWLRSPATGATRPEYRQSIEEHLDWYLHFPQIVVTGANESSAAIVARLERSGYRVARAGSAWTILLRK